MPPIETLDSLRGHLQTALELEHTTIPPYLCAMYTMTPMTNEASYYVIRGVVVEEMLHMVLVANVLNAVGGHPSVNGPHFVPEYPAPLPHSDGTVIASLLPFSPGAVDGFIAIERPAKPGAPPEADHYHTIGQFYEAIEDGLRRLADELGPGRVFTGRPSLQVTGGLYYGGGEPVAVHDLDTALTALSVVVDEGEGIHHSIWDGDKQFFGQPRELAHYFRFEEIRQGRYYKRGDTPKTGPTGDPLPVDWDSVLRMAPNPKVRDYPPGELRQAAEAFNRSYTRLLDHLHDAFSGSPGALEHAVVEMFQLKEVALDLVNNPYPGAPELQAGPTFEIALARHSTFGRYRDG